MSLSRKTADALDDRLARGEPAGTLTVEHGDRRLELQLTAVSAVGVAFDLLAFHADGPDDRPVEDLRAWGDRLAARVTYLMEPLVVLEVDPANAEVELRSDRPTPRGDARSFYEARLTRPGSLRLGRVTFDSADRRRRPAPCQLTREALERLIDDIDGAAA